MTDCQVCNGSAMVALCGKTEEGSDGPCVLRGGHFGPCWGEEDVASDWEPVASCRACCVCSCGSTDATRAEAVLPCPHCHESPTPGQVAG